ncbi:hypothetical protein [Thalassolituus sp.]|nr:hypothetical protein [uncultured Thalassolituus sp.]
MLLSYLILSFFIVGGGIATCCMKEARKLQAPCNSLNVQPYPTKRR